jgi:hypothetical protein
MLRYICQMQCYRSWHRVDADPDPGITFFLDPDPATDPDPTPCFTHVEQTNKKFTLIHSNDSLHCFIFLVSVIGDRIFNILAIY